MLLKSIGGAFALILALLPFSVSAADCSTAGGVELFPRGRLFDPLLADPRWPHFSASYQYFIDDAQLKDAGAVSFGESFGLAGWNAGGCWQLDFHAGVFALFDLDAESKDLINADYFVGIPIVYKIGNVATMVRIYHQSSHLGDEFLLRSHVDRINLSYEGIDFKLSYTFPIGLRFYAGGGYLLSSEPQLDPFSAQLGIEYRAHSESLLSPVFAVDSQWREEGGWPADLSARLGVQVQSKNPKNQSVQLLLEYYRGRNPNGQFYERTLEYIGFGVHVQLFPPAGGR